MRPPWNVGRKRILPHSGWTSPSGWSTVSAVSARGERRRYAGQERQGQFERGGRVRLLSGHAPRRRKGSGDRDRFRRARRERGRPRDRRRVRLAGLSRGGARSVLALDPGAARARRRAYEGALAAAPRENRAG